jgi:hypothetical protein
VKTGISPQTPELGVKISALMSQSKKCKIGVQTNDTARETATQIADKVALVAKFLGAKPD